MPNLDRLERIYRQVPGRKCRDGCSDCCGAIHWGPTENQNILANLALEGKHALQVKVYSKEQLMTMDCPYLMNGRCSIYAYRPLVCRLYGVTVHPLLRCDGKARYHLAGPFAQGLMTEISIMDKVSMMSWDFYSFYNMRD